MRRTMLSGTAAIALAAALSLTPGLAGADTTTTTDTNAQTQVDTQAVDTQATDTQGTATQGTETQSTDTNATDAEATTEAEADAQNGIDAAELMGDSVENSAGDVLGDIETLVVAEDGTIEHVVLGVGGFLGIGEKEVALPWDRFTVVAEDERIVADVTREELEAMPEFEWPENYQQGSMISSRSDADNDGVDDSLQTADRTADGTTTADTNQAVDTDDEDDDAAKVDDAGATLQPDAQVLAGSLIGATILSHDDREVGDVEDVVIAADGSAQGVIVEIGGFLGIDEKQVMIAWKDLEVRRDDDGNVLVRTGLNEDAMKALQDYDIEAARAGDSTTTTNQ